jgi:uridine kinase
MPYTQQRRRVLNDPRLLESLAGRIARRQRSHPLRVAIDGITAAGKTTLADELVAPLRARGRPVIRASVDGFHRPRAERYRRGANSPRGYYDDAFDYAALRRVLLLPLGPDGDRRYRLNTLDLATDQPTNGPYYDAPPEAVLLCDGVFLLRPELDDCWDFRIFLQADEATAVRRAGQRDRHLFGGVERAKARYWQRYIPAHRLYLAQVHPQTRADVIIKS